MPNASKYIIDVANIRPGGNPIKGLYVGSSEKKYATLGNKCIYDKVFYELSVDNITNVEPNAQTVTISSYTSKRTHGNGAVDTLYINPSTKQVTANTSTANTKDTTVVVNQALTLNGTTTGTGVTVTITQIKDYPTGLTLTISPKSTIPAAGGSISSSLTNYTYSVKANYKSGNNNVDVTSDSNTTITANVTGVTAASKGTTASNVTTAGTITFTASYTCNGKTVTTTTDVNITQDENVVVSYANPTFTLTPSSNQTLPASGGRVTASVSNVQQVRTWSSTSTDSFSPSFNTTWAEQTISCNSRGTVTGDTLTLGTTTATVTANGKSTTKSYVVYQQANDVTDYSKPTGLNLSCADIPAGGGTVTVATGGTISQTRTYTSKATDTINPTVTITWNPSQTATANSLGTTVKERTKITTLTATYTANSQSNTASVDVYQGANAQSTTPLWGDLSLTAVTLSCEDVPASGGTVTPSWSGAAKQNRRYQYTSGSYTDWELVNITPTVTWSPTSKTGSDLGTTVKARTSLGDCTATFVGHDSQSDTKSITVYQEANVQATTPEWGDISLTAVTLSCTDVPASGGTVTPSWSGTAKQNRRYQYTSGSYTDWELVNITPTVTWNPTGKTGNNLGQTEKARTSLGDCTATFTGNSSKTATKAITVYQEANTYTDSWNDPAVEIKANPSNVITYSAQTVVLTAAATQSGTRTWTSKASTALTNTDFTWTWTTEDITGFSSSVNNNVCTVTASANDSTSDRHSRVYGVVAKGADDKTGKDGVFILQKRKSTLTPKIISISATVTNNNPPTPKYQLDIRSDTHNMSKDIVIALASGNSTSYIYNTNNHPTGSTEGSFYEEFSASSVPIYLYVKLSQGEGSCNMSVSATNSLFNMSARTVGESEWVQIGGGNVSLDTSSRTVITLTFNQL